MQTTRVIRVFQAILLLLSGAASTFQCPKWLRTVCDPVCVATHCGAELAHCLAGKECRKSFTGTLGCMSSHNQTNITAQTACMVPDQVERDLLFNCMIEKHRCIQMPDNNPKYPKCRDAEVPGDANVSAAHIATGDWYKVHSWRLGEPIECMDCQKATFQLAEPTGSLVFNSTWWEPGYDSELHEMNVVAHMASDEASRGPGKLFNTGEMFGLTYWEPYTIVKDGSREEEPFVFFYVCGGTLQGNYTTAFAVARTPTLSSTLHTRLAGVASSIGLKDSDFCTVNNSCFNR